jgi:hypothetical protein
VARLPAVSIATALRIWRGVHDATISPHRLPYAQGEIDGTASLNPYVVQGGIPSLKRRESVMTAKQLKWTYLAFLFASAVGSALFVSTKNTGNSGLIEVFATLRLSVVRRTEVQHQHAHDGSTDAQEAM